jgi:hypothetical protein
LLSRTYCSEWSLLLIGNGFQNILREFHTHFPKWIAYDLREVVQRPDQVRTHCARRKGLALVFCIVSDLDIQTHHILLGEIQAKQSYISRNFNISEGGNYKGPCNLCQKVEEQQAEQMTGVSVSKNLRGTVLGFELRVSLLLYLLSHYASIFVCRIFSS